MRNHVLRIVEVVVFFVVVGNEVWLVVCVVYGRRCLCFCLLALRVSGDLCMLLNSDRLCESPPAPDRPLDTCPFGSFLPIAKSMAKESTRIFHFRAAAEDTYHQQENIDI